MKKINEIFYSLQGEGMFAGTPAVFIRFAGCNLKCPFCDTKHQEGKLMTDAEIIQEVSKYPCHLVVLTGGEPTLQVDEGLCEGLQRAGKYIAIETNGTRDVPSNVNYITCSPKVEYVRGAKIKLQYCDELKVVFTGSNDMSIYDGIQALNYYIQPCDTYNEEQNKLIKEKAVKFCLDNPKWRLSLQTQKILDIQ